MNRIRYFVLGSFALIASCSSTKTQRVEPIWVGKSQQELIKKMGLPNEKKDDGHGGQVFIYKDIEEHQVHGTNEKKKLTVERSFFLDRSGKIYQLQID